MSNNHVNLDSDTYTALEEELKSLRQRVAELEQQLINQQQVPFRMVVGSVNNYEIIMLDPQGYILTWNEGAELLKGYTAQDIIGKHFSCFYSIEDINDDIPKLTLLKAIEQGRFEVEGWRLRKDGSKFWADVVTTALKDESGKLLGFSKMTRDVTDRKQVEQAQARLSTILEATSDFVSSCDPEGQILYLNKIGRQILGIGEKDDLTFNIYAAHPEWATKIIREQGIPTAIRDGVWRGETALLSHDGQEIPVSQVLVAHKTTDGELEFLSTIARDISEIKQSSATLQQAMRDQKELLAQTEYSAQLLREVIDATPDWLFVKNHNFRYMLTNKSFAAAIGRTPETVMGKNDLELGFPPEQVFGNPDAGIRGFRADDEQVLAGEEIYNPFDPATYADGSVHIFDTQKLPMRDPEGNIFGVLAFCRDITERHHAEEALRQKTQELEVALKEIRETQAQLVQSEKMSSLGQLVAGIAHEVNNPINFIHGNILHANEYTENLLNLIELYTKHYPQPVPEIQDEIEAIELEFLVEDLPKLLSSMKLGAERIRQIVLSLRNFSRLDEAEHKAVDVHEGIDNTILILQHRLKEKVGRGTIQIVKEYGNLPLIECYAGQLNQVFMNIITNGLDALEEYNHQRSLEEIKINPSIIKISTEVVDNNWVQIRIADNGTGIPKEVQNRLFDPFFTTKSIGKGTGLGLSISYQIVVEKHKGELQCISTPGEGAEFVIKIPLKQQHLIN